VYEQVARFGDDGRVAIERQRKLCPVASGRGVVLGVTSVHRKPLQLHY
jgi:hypothetical protein